MKLITAIIKPYKVDAVTEALKAIGVHGLTVTEARGFGRPGGHTETYRGAEYRIDFVPKTRLDVLVNDNEVDTAVEAIITSAVTGKIGDGKVWVSAVERVIRIRTSEENEDAV